MHREELEEEVVCASCGTLFSIAEERGFGFGEDLALCFDCATQRGGVYDEETDRWTTEPNVADILQKNPPGR